MQKQVLQLDLFYSELIMQIYTECKCFGFLRPGREFCATKYKIHRLYFFMEKKNAKWFGILYILVFRIKSFTK